MKQLHLTNSDKVALLDDEDYQLVVEFGNWYLSKKDNRVITKVGTGSSVSMTIHLNRFVMRYYGPLEVDHMSTDTLDNRKENLQLLTSSDNSFKRDYQHTIISNTGYKNVTKERNLYRSCVKVERKQYEVRFKTAFQAAVESQNMLTILRPALTVDMIFEKGRGFLGI